MTIIIRDKSFSGTGNVFNGSLSAAVRGLAQFAARQTASTITPQLTDNSGGTAADGAIADSAPATASARTGSNCVALTEANAAAAGVNDALATIIARVNAVNARVGALGEGATAITDSTGGTSGGNTIAAIDVAGTGAGSALVSAVAYNAHLAEMDSRFRQVVGFINRLATACGTVGVTDGMTVDKNHSVTVEAVNETLGSAVTGDDADANAAVLVTEWDARQEALGKAISEMAEALNRMTLDANANVACETVAG